MGYPRALRLTMAVVAGALALATAARGHGEQHPGGTTPGDWAVLTVHVPQQAKVIVNEMPTQRTGKVRRFYSVGLKPGLKYPYDVRAELTRDGWTQVRSKRVVLQAGQLASVAFAFGEEKAGSPAGETANPFKEERTESPARVWTELSLIVPPDAVVYIDDREMPGTGSLRQYRTMRLAADDPPADHRIRVVLRQQGQSTAKEDTIAIGPGQSRALTFDFSEPEPADP